MNNRTQQSSTTEKVLQILWFLIIILCIVLIGFSLFGQGALKKIVSDWLFPAVLVLAALYLFGRWLYKRNSRPVKQNSDEALMLETLKGKIEKTRPKAFKKQKRTLLMQTERMQEKESRASKSIEDNFTGSRITKTRFSNALAGGIHAFTNNSEKILDLMNLFDEDGFEQLERQHLTFSQPYKDMLDQLNEADQLLALNEKILSSTDRLERELLNLSSQEAEKQLEPVLEDLEQAANQTSLYQSEHSKKF